MCRLWWQSVSTRTRRVPVAVEITPQLSSDTWSSKTVQPVDAATTTRLTVNVTAAVSDALFTGRNSRVTLDASARLSHSERPLGGFRRLAFPGAEGSSYTTAMADTAS